MTCRTDRYSNAKPDTTHVAINVLFLTDFISSRLFPATPIWFEQHAAPNSSILFLRGVVFSPCDYGLLFWGALLWLWSFFGWALLWLRSFFWGRLYSNCPRFHHSLSYLYKEKPAFMRFRYGVRLLLACSILQKRGQSYNNFSEYANFYTEKVQNNTDFNKC